jgi:hypothetical protein
MKKTVTSRMSGNEQNFGHSLKILNTSIKPSNHPKLKTNVINNPATFFLSYSLLL